MKVLTKDQAQAWLNQPEQEGIRAIICWFDDESAELVYEDNQRRPAWFAVATLENIYRKNPWNWPKPDESTPVDAKVWVRDTLDQVWERRYYFADTRVFPLGYTSWTGNGDRTPWAYIVLANPDDLDEMPPQGLEV